jgi:hypothetical protein
VLLYLALGSWLAGDWLRADLERAVRRVRERADADGFDLVRLGAPRVESASQGERVQLELDVRSGGEVAVAAACDDGCDDLTLRILDRHGRELGRDVAGDAVPVVSAIVEDGDRPYALEVAMRGCHESTCRYAWQLLQIEPREGAGDDGSTGSCFAVGPDGLVLTAQHVLEGAREIDVRFPGGSPLPATVEKVDAGLDVALLRVAAPTPHYLNLAPPAGVRLGEPVFTIGFPAVDVLGEEPKYNDGTVGALGGPDEGPPSLQLSVPVQPGSSGGPVVNDRGQVVGVVESVADQDFFGGDSGLVPQSMSWAVKADALRTLLPPVATRPATSSRAEAVARVLDAVCLVETR